MIYPRNVIASASILLMTWLLILALYVTRRTLTKHGRRVWGDYAFPLVGIQGVTIFLVIRIVTVFTFWTIAATACMSLSMIGTALVYDRRNSDDQFMLRSGIFYLLLTAISLVDLAACVFNIWR